MRLTYKDVVTTLLAAATVAVTLAVVEGWGWPALGSPRTGILALFALGMVGCTVGARTEEMADKAKVKGPGLMAGATLGGLAGIIFIVGLIVGTEFWLIALAADIVLLWLIATVRHTVVPAPPRLAGAH